VLKQENNMPFSKDDKALIKKRTLVQRSWFTKVISRISFEKLDERRAWYTAWESEGNWKQWL